MASSSGASSGIGMIQSSGSEEGHDQQIMDQRKRKRMVSNRESARRSRMRKQNHLDNLIEQQSQLRKENNNILSSMNVSTQLYLNVEAENSILRAQMAELGQRLQSLNDIINCINTIDSDFGIDDIDQIGEDSFMDMWNSSYMNQPSIMASSADMFMY